MRRLIPLLFLLLLGCEAGLQPDPDVQGIPDDDDAADDDDATDDDDAGLVPDCSGVGGTSTLPGACVLLEPVDPIAVDVALTGIEIPWVMMVEADVNDVVPEPQDAGDCHEPDDSGLIVFERIQGGGNVFCRCDEGLCDGFDATPRTIPRGATPGRFTWNGRNWQGPSDTGAPPDEPFPPGLYTLTVSAVGRYQGNPFVVANTVQVQLVD